MQDMAEEKLTPLIMIDDTYGISVDPIDYSLRKNVLSDKTGKIRQDTVGYYSSLESCLRAYALETMHDSLESDKNMTLKEATEIISSAMDKVFGTIKQAFPDYEVIRK